jgi:Tfp pilus assembly protein PilF
MVVRIRRSLGVLALAGLVGCQSTEKTSKDLLAEKMAAGQKTPGLWQRMTGQGTAPAIPQSTSAAADFARQPASKPGTPVKVETEVEFAETSLAGAVDPNTLGSERDRRLDQARQQFNHILQRDPKNARGTLGLARVYSETGDKAKAAEYLEKYFAINPRDHKAAFDFAMVYGRKKDFAAAASGCEFALSLDPENREYRKHYGFFLALCGQADQAVAVLTHNRMMTEADARHNVAGILSETNQVEQAKQQLRLAIAADPQHDSSKMMLQDLDGSGIVPAQYVQPR